LKKYNLATDFLLNFNVAEAQTKDQTKTTKEISEKGTDSINKKVTGFASWYRYRGGHFAASTEFKKGSILRVINPANGKFIDVTVNDYGPNKRKHPKRVIDLDKVAFGKIASLKSGLVKIVVMPLLTL
jgi:rare lipoprotein A (peptidoglycan hydrolase)